MEQLVAEKFSFQRENYLVMHLVHQHFVLKCFATLQVEALEVEEGKVILRSQIHLLNAHGML